MDMNKKLKLLKNLKLLGIAFEGLCILKEIDDLLRKNKNKRSCAVRPINRHRRQDGFFDVTFLKIKDLDSGQFFVYTRMHPAQYNVLLNLVSPLMVKTSIRVPVSAACRLAVLLFYLSQGVSVQALASAFKLGKETVRQIILETSELVWQVLKPAYVAEPSSEEYQMISDDFWTLRNIPNCLGAIAGKHLSLRCPPNAGSQYLNCRKFLSIVLMAVCDTKYTFTHIDIGTYGNQSDGGIFQASHLGKKILRNDLPMPESKNLPGSGVEVPHYFVSDTGFPLNVNIMRPYSGVILSPEEVNFNERLARAHQTIENAFGILVARWRVLLTTLYMLPENAEKIIFACIALHNFIMKSEQSECYCPADYVDWEDFDGQRHDGLWRDEININIPSIAPHSCIHQYGGKISSNIRNKLRDFLYEN